MKCSISSATDSALFNGLLCCVSKVWDVESKTMVWKAKNVPHDEVRLEVPIWITSIAYMPIGTGGATSPGDCSGNMIATGTAHKHIRMYDTRVQRQPCMSWGVGDFRVTNVVPSYQNEQHLYVADCAGGILMYDLRNGRRIRTLNGFDGSVRDLSHDVSIIKQTKLCSCIIIALVCFSCCSYHVA
jgi:WD40 repeat protein